MDLFEHAASRDSGRAPLAERMRPASLDELVGQEHLTGPGRLLRRALETDSLGSLILWGPPGTGKTTLAHLLAGASGARFVALSAVLSGVKDIRESIAAAERDWSERRRKTLLFIDEIHRFNKGQQDALLPHVERGTVTLVGATTENPSFELNAALLSRCRVVTLKSLDESQVLDLLRRALTDERGLAGKVEADEDALKKLAAASAGDARRALTALEAAARDGGPVDDAAVEEALQKKVLLYDKAGEEHFNVISAFIKAMRGSDPDGALYWMVRMLESGEDPRFVLRRMVIFASEDVGNADPRALTVALDASQAYERMGMPEGSLPMTQAVLYLAMAPKSNAVLTAYAAARKAVQERGALPVPMHLRNAPTKLMKGMGYGGGYRYPHDFEGNYVQQEHLPDALRGQRFFTPSESGEERGMGARLEALRTTNAGTASGARRDDPAPQPDPDEG